VCLDRISEGAELRPSVKSLDYVGFTARNRGSVPTLLRSLARGKIERPAC
jgi:hypothetical protein